MFESLTITTILLVLFFMYQNMRLGLTSAVPQDPSDRMRFYASECLTQLKTLLSRGQVRSFDEHRIEFVPAGETHVCELTVDGGSVVLRRDPQGTSTISTLGEEGTLQFEKVSDRGLLVTIQAKAQGASHRLAVRLEADFEQCGKQAVVQR